MRNRGLTLVEVLVSIIVAAMLIIVFVKLFVMSQSIVTRTRHMLAARQILSNYIDREIAAGFNNGGYKNLIETPLNITIDNNGTPDTTDDLVGTIQSDPIANYAIGVYGTPPNTRNYRIAGFIVKWNEQPSGVACSERSITYVADHI